jgi:hypothetical protein
MVMVSYNVPEGTPLHGQGRFQVAQTIACTKPTTTTLPPWGITVATDKSVYGPSDVVQITGSVSGPDCHYYCPCGACTCDTLYSVELEIRNDLRTVYMKELTLFDQSVFSDSFSLSYALESGDYQVIARFASGPAATVTLGYPPVEAISNFRLEGTATTFQVAPTTITPVTSTVTQTSTVLSTTTVSTVVTSVTTVTVEGLQMQVVSNSSVSGLVFDSTRGLLNFTVSGPSGTHGFFDATIARSLLSGQPVVFIDGVLSPASASQDANFWYVHVTYMHSEHHVTIGGSNTVPEFPAVPLLMVLLLLPIVIFRRAKCEKFHFVTIKSFESG